MQNFETAKFQKLRKRLKSELHKKALKNAVESVIDSPEAGKVLKGELRDLRSIRYAVHGQSFRLIYKVENDSLILLSFGPR